MKRASTRTALALAAVSAVIVASCGAGGAPAGGNGKVKIAFVAGQIGITFYTGVECGA